MEPRPTSFTIDILDQGSQDRSTTLEERRPPPLVAPTSTSSRGRNVPATASVLVGLVAVAALPAAIAAAEWLDRFDLINAGYAVPVAGVLAIATLLLARRGRRRCERTLGRVGGRRTARLGKVLGLLALGLAASGAIALATYVILRHLAE